MSFESLSPVPEEDQLQELTERRWVRLLSTGAYRLSGNEWKIHSPRDMRGLIEIEGELVNRGILEHENVTYEGRVIVDTKLNIWFIPLNYSLAIESEVIEE